MQQGNRRKGKLPVYVLTAGVTLLAALGGLWLANADERDARVTPEQIETAKRHQDFATLAAAQTVVVGRIRVRIDGVAEIFPPIYEMTMFVTPTEVIAGKAKPDKAFAVRFSRQQEDEPMFDDVPYLVAVGDDDDTNRLVLLKPAGEHLAGVAKIAAHSGTQQRNKNAALAANNPEMHPLFEELAKAKHIVLIRFSGDDGGGVSFDVRTRLEEHDNVTVVQSLRGDVKPGEHRRLAFDEGALVGGKDGLLIALFETRNERPVVIATLPANEEMLRVAAAATKKDPAGLLKTAEAAREAYKRERGAARARDLFRGVFGASSGASEPSEGASTPSFDGTPSGEEFERPRAN